MPVRLWRMQSAQDYYPFGMVMPGRSFQGSDDYRYGFNGKEKDDEVKGAANSLDFGARIYDPRIGRWLSLDPEAHQYPQLSDYVFVLNSPLSFIDPTGKVVKPAANLTKAEKQRVEAAIKLSSEKVPDLYTKLNTLRYHSGSRTFLVQPDENSSEEEKLMYEEAFDVIITVGVKDLDPENGKEGGSQSGSEFTINDAKTHTDGESGFADGNGFKGAAVIEGKYQVRVNENGIAQTVPVESPNQFDGINISTYMYLDDEAEVHFEVFLDDFINYGTKEDDGRTVTHEFGHIEGFILYQFNTFYFMHVFEGEDQGGHEDGNLGGDNADNRTTEYENSEI